MKKIILFGLVLIILSSFVLADTNFGVTSYKDDAKSFKSTGSIFFYTESYGNRDWQITHMTSTSGNLNDQDYTIKIHDSSCANALATYTFNAVNIGATGYIEFDIDGSYTPYNMSNNTVYCIEYDKTDSETNAVTYTTDTYNITNTTTNNPDGISIWNTAGTHSPTTYDARVDISSMNFLITVNDESTIVSPSTFELTASNIFNSTSIESFTADITNTTDTVSIYTSNGTIYYPIITELVNISVFNVSGNTYFNRSYTDYNISTDLDSEHTQAYVNLILTNLPNTTQYADVRWNITNIDEGISESRFINDGVTKITLFNATSGNYNYTAQKTGYPNINGTFTLNALDNKTVYAEVGFFAEINLYDEATMENFNVSRTNNTKLTIVCKDIGSFEYEFDNYTENITVACEYTKLRFSVTYDDITYTRNILSSETDIFSQDVYLIDLTTTQSIYNAFVVNDYTGEYDNPSLYIKKNMEGAQVIIHSDNLDIENKISVYPIENDEYIIELRSDNNPTEVLGFYGSDISGTKEITVTSANVNLNDIEVPGTGVFTYSYAKNVSDDLYAYAVYSDIESLTTEVTWSLWYLNETNGSIESFYEVTSLGTYGNITFTGQNITDYINNSVFSSISFVKDGEASVYYIQINEEPVDKRDGTAFGYYTISIVQWGIVIFLSVIALSGTITTQNVVNYAIIGIAGVSVIFGLMSISIILLVLSLVITFMYNLKSSEETRIAR